MDAKDVPTNTITTVGFTGVTLVVKHYDLRAPDWTVRSGGLDTDDCRQRRRQLDDTVSPTFNNDIFFNGHAIPVDPNLENGGHGNTGSTPSFNSNSSDSSLSFQW
jgi:hypothetical protein